MKIAIIGAGAMGCLFGAKLSNINENEVFLIDIWEEHVNAINNNGLTIEEEGKQILYDRVKAVKKAEEAGPCDIAVIFVKSTITGEALKKIVLFWE